MDKEIRNIFENYQDTWDMTPQESFKKDKEFFQYVIENNDHLAPLRNFKLKYIFELYKAKLRQEFELEAPGLINENTDITKKQAFDILQESTKDVTKEEAYVGVKSIFESICTDVLIYKSNVLLEQTYRDTASANYQTGMGSRQASPAPAAAEKVTVTLKSGEKVGGVPTGKPAAQGMTQVKLDNGRVFAFSDDVIERPGATETITTDTEVKVPTGPTADQIQLQQAERQLGTQASQIKDLQTAASTPRASEIEAQAEIKKLQAQNAQLAKQHQELEAKEQGMQADQKAQSDALQAQMKQQMDMFTQTIQALANQQAQGAQQQAQAAATDQGLADRMRAAAGRGPAAPAATETETETETETVSAEAPKPGIMGKLARGVGKGVLGAGKAVGNLAGKGLLGAGKLAGRGLLGGAKLAGKGIKNLSQRDLGADARKVGRGIASVAPYAGAATGAALGSALGPAGMMAGGAVGKTLGDAAQQFATAEPGQRISDVKKMNVGKSALTGAALGGLGAYGTGQFDAAPGPEMGDHGMPVDNVQNAPGGPRGNLDITGPTGMPDETVAGQGVEATPVPQPGSELRPDTIRQSPDFDGPDSPLQKGEGQEEFTKRRRRKFTR